MVKTLRIENMHCGACVRRVTMTLNKVPTTQTEDVQIGAARIRTDADADALLAALAKAGYPSTIE